MEIVKTAEETLSDYKKTAFKISTFIMICFLLRYAASGILVFIFLPLSENMSESAKFIGRFALSAVFLQILPSVIGYLMFVKKWDGGLKRLYAVPKLMKKATANFPSLYGAAQIVNILTLLVIFLITKENDLAKSINTLNALQPPDTASAIFLFFDLVVIAPVFEEFMFRGVVMNELRPYGNGFAILTSGILFGLFHGNFNQVFYTAVMGIALGYIVNVTNSLVPTVAMHAMMNGISGIVLMLMSTDSVQRFILNGDTSEIPNSDMLLVAAYAIYMVCVFALIIVGMISAVVKIAHIKRYKVKKVCPEITSGKKLSILLASVPAIISIIMIIDTFGGFTDMLIEKLIK